SSDAASGSGNASGKYNVGYVNLANTDVFCMSRINALREVTEGTDFNVSFVDGNNDNQKQIDYAKSFISRDVDALILVPADSEAITPAVEEANANEIPVICFGIKSNGGDYIYVGSNDYEAGYLQGEFMADELPENAKILYCAGSEGYQQTTDRRTGFKEALTDKGRDDIEILSEQDGEYAKEKAMEVCDAWIQAYSTGNGEVEFDAIVAANDQMALGCIESLKNANVLTTEGEILISGVDGTDDAIQAVSDGYMAQTVLQDAQGQAEAAYDVLQKLVAGEEVESEVIVPFQSITQSNVAEFQ
ncbi:MAG: sugar ABC transporter substrate-binding protein, partial [Eubacteriales bacterium]|nr:sugar ABC transporter substrate-binding protein [Eubacteriales bacterium]